MKRFVLNITLGLIISCAFIAAPNGTFISQSYAACSDTAGPAVNWENCRKRNLIMGSADFSGANFTRTDLSASDLRNSNLSNATFIKTNLVRASLSGSQAKDTNFESVVASRTDFSNGNYENANFSKAEISRSNFANSNLENAKLSKADFSRVNFSNANLKSVDMSFTNISRSDLTNIKIDETFTLTGSYMFLTNISGLDLSNLKGLNLKQWQVDMACGDDTTKLPKSLKRPANWPCEFDAQE